MANIFKLKFAYKQENDLGEIKKSKTEIFVEGINYSDAEKTALEIIADREYSRYEECEYEIIKTKYTDKQFIFNNVLGWDGGSINNLIEHFFSDENDGFFIINTKFIPLDEDEKPTKATHIVPGKSITNAIAFLKEFLVSRGNRQDQFVITDSKLDGADSLYLTETTHKSFIVNDSEAE